LNGGTSYPLTLNVQQNVTVNFLGNGNSGVVCVLEDDAHKIGDGVMRFWYTGNGITAPPTTANSGNFYVDQGTLNWTVTANSAGQFPQDFNGGATGVSHSLLDGGISGNGVANYFFANGTTLIADFAHNPADGVNPSPRYVHFNFGINNGGDANSNMTINVTNQPLVLTSAPTNPVDPVPTTNWVGTLKKIGIGTLMLDTSRIASISAGAKLDLLDGDVMLYGGSGHDPFTSGANSVGVTVADSATLDDSTNTPLTVQYVYGHGFLVVRQNASLKLAPNNPLPNAAAALSIAGTTGAWTGKLDLTNNSLLLDNTGSVSFLQLVDQIRQGYHNGDWTPVGGIFSSLAGGVASDTENPFKTGVGILGGLMVQAAPLGAPLGAPPPGTILIRYTYYGDANCDGTVNTLDFNSLAQNFNSTSQIWSGGDFNYDGVVNALDFNALATNFGQVLASPPLGSVVPEPSLAAAILSGLLMLRRIRRE
jgi:hypothetical protein